MFQNWYANTVPYGTLSSQTADQVLPKLDGFYTIFFNSSSIFQHYQSEHPFNSPYGKLLWLPSPCTWEIPSVLLPDELKTTQSLPTSRGRHLLSFSPFSSLASALSQTSVQSNSTLPSSFYTTLFPPPPPHQQICIIVYIPKASHLQSPLSYFVTWKSLSLFSIYIQSIKWHHTSVTCLGLWGNTALSRLMLETIHRVYIPSLLSSICLSLPPSTVLHQIYSMHTSISCDILPYCRLTVITGTIYKIVTL